MFSSRFALIFSLLVAIEGVLSNSASAQQSARDYFDPIVSHHQFTVFIRNFDIAREQRRIVEMVFMDYVDAIDSLVARADAEADQVGRRTVNDALSGRAIVDPTELRELRLAVLDVYQSHVEAVADEFEKLVLGVRSVINPPQRPTFDDDVRNLRRIVLLHPRHAERNYHEYAGDGVDVHLLVEEAAAPGGELHGLHDPSAPLSDSPIAAILGTYARELDEFLVATASAHRHARMELRKARISRNPNELRAAEAAVIDLWNRLYSLNSRAVQDIGDVIADRTGDDQRQQWLRRFDEACFAWMFAKSLPDRQYEWLMQQNLPTQQEEGVQDVYAEYLARRFVLTSRAITLMIRARAEHQTIVHSMMNPSGLDGATRRLFDDLLRNSGELSTLDANTTTEFEKLLDSNRLRAFRNAFRR